MANWEHVWLVLCSVGIASLGACSGETTDATADAQVDATTASDIADSNDNAVADMLMDVTTQDEPHPIGMEAPPFALEDINPTSETFGQMIDSADLAGAPFAQSCI